jgi:hypothetical protein
MNRRTLNLGLMVSAAATAGSVLWMMSAARSEQAPGVIKAQQIVLVDPAGHARIALGTNPQTGAAAIRVLDAVSGKPRIVIGTADDQSSRIELHDADGNLRADLVLMGNGVRLSLADAALKGGIVLGSGADGKTVLVLNDEKPTHRVTLGLNANHDGNLAIYDANGTPIWTAVPAPHP